MSMAQGVRRMPGQSTPGQHAANQVQSITAANSVNGESRTYNSLLQMTRQTVTGLQTGTHLDVQYNFPATGNNGQLQSQKDMMSPSGEQVSYTYDTLKRLASATDQNGTNWSQTFNYDGFGNLTTVGGAGGAPGMQIAVDPATNRIQVGVSYDANGNDLSNGGSYDIENRLLQATVVQTIKYAYAAGNKRIWRGVTGQLDEVAFWSVTGQKLATYNLVTQGQATQFVMAGQNVYFGGKLVAKGVSPNVTNLQPVASDRLGSIGKFYPYGQEINPTQGSSTEKFTGYFRDVETGLDYADQRYYESWRGRFATADPSVNSAGAGDPGSWNRYAFVQGDPINYTDRRGLRRDDDNDWDWGYGLIPSFSFGGGAHSIVLDWLNIAYGLCDDGEKGTAFREVVRPCIQAELLLLAAQAGKAPACWQNAGKVDQTLGDLGSNIMEISGMNISDSSHLAGLDSLIHSTIVSEMATLLGSIASGSKGPPAFYVGGHFNLDLDQNAIGTTLGDDFGAFTGAFGGFIDGTRQYANLAEGNYTLHSKQNVGGSFDFHFDIYNPLSGNPLDA